MAERVNKLSTKYFPPNHAQLSKAVKGHDPNYRIGASSYWKSYAIFLFILLLAVFGTYGVLLLVAK